MTAAGEELLYVTVDLWHPDCWTLRTTEGTDAGLLGRRTMLHGGTGTGAFRAYGGSRDAVDALVEAARDSPLTDTVTDLPPRAGPARGTGSVARGILVEFDPGPSIRSAFTERGFLHAGPTRHEGGRERRSLVARTDRPSLGRAVDEIETAYDADVEVVRVRAVAADGTDDRPADRLSPRQREAFGLARARGYYGYPRESTARDLAAELGVSKTTFLEHLRKAEAKLLADADP